jgi:hypothetical protein
MQSACSAVMLAILDTLCRITNLTVEDRMQPVCFGARRWWELVVFGSSSLLVASVCSYQTSSTYFVLDMCALRLAAQS